MRTNNYKTDPAYRNGIKMFIEMLFNAYNWQKKEQGILNKK